MRDGHSSGTPVASRLVQPTRMAGSETNLIEDIILQPHHSYSVLLPVGFTMPDLLPESAVSSYLTFSPLPSVEIRTDNALWRYAFCGTFPEIALAGRYPAP